jgi:hypothetical protein
VTLYLLGDTVDDARELRQEILAVLIPFERAGTVTPKGSALLSWARQLSTG